MNITEFKEISEKIRVAEKSNEIPTREEALMSIAILNQISLSRIGDYLLYAASVNLLNRYVKIYKDQMNYRFKEFLYPFVYTIMVNKPSGIRMFMTRDENMQNLPLLMVDIQGIHCSFHNLKMHLINDMAKKNNYAFTYFTWDNIKKQKCSSTLLRLAFENKNHLSPLGRNGQDIFEGIKNSMNKYDQSSKLDKHIPFIHAEILLSKTQENGLQNQTFEMSNHEKKSILVSPIGDADPINQNFDGPMLHIVRKYMPQIIYLLLTKKMQTFEKKEILSLSIKHLYESKKLEIPQIIYVHLENENPALFDDFGFTNFFDEIFEKYQNTEIYVNISSGTPQMIASMCLEIVTNKRDVKTVQVKNFNIEKSFKKTPIDKTYDFSLNKDNNTNYINRAELANLLSFNNSKTKQKLESYINKFDYISALEIANNNQIKNTKLHKLLTKAVNMEQMQVQGEEFLDFVPAQSLNHTINTIALYYEQWELEFFRKRYINYILKSTSLMYAIIKYHMIKTLKNTQNEAFWKSLENKDEFTIEGLKTISPKVADRINTKFGKTFATTSWLIDIYLEMNSRDKFITLMEGLRGIEKRDRHLIAHEIDLSKVKSSTFENDAKIMQRDMNEIFQIVFKSNMHQINFDYFKQLNELILNEIKNTF